jgi:hypothetical protein
LAQASRAEVRPRYIGLGEALLRTLEELGGEADVDTLLVETWRRYGPESRGPVKTWLRLFRHPSGYYWSPEAQATLERLQTIGLILLDREKRVVMLNSNIYTTS